MSQLTDEAKRIINTVNHEITTNVASSRFLGAIALALVAIAVELEKMNSDEVKEVRDRTWLYK